MNNISIENFIEFSQMSKVEIENLIAEQTEHLNKIEKQLATQTADGNISYAVILDRRADLILKEICYLQRKLQNWQ